nr:putative reverse transcriptase domain-containing protein [Tanacetum cinerariifolium]
MIKGIFVSSCRIIAGRNTRSSTANNTNPPNETADEVTRQLNTALPNMLTQLVQALRGNRANQKEATPSYIIKTFRASSANEFFGTEGAVGLKALSMCSISLSALQRAKLNSLLVCCKAKLESEFWNHKMVGSDIDGYTARFHVLESLVPHMVTPKSQRVNRYVRGMDWLSKLRAKIVCYEKIIQIPLPNGSILEVHGQHLIPRAMPVAKSPYRLAPTEMQKLSNHLKELQEKGKANIVVDTLSRKERMKSRRAQAMSMTIHFSIKARILEAQIKASKGANTLVEMLKGLDKEFERKEDGRLDVAKRIWVPVYGNLRTLIMNEAHTLKYSVHPGADK